MLPDNKITEYSHPNVGITTIGLIQLRGSQNFACNLNKPQGGSNNLQSFGNFSSKLFIASRDI